MKNSDVLLGLIEGILEKDEQQDGNREKLL